MKRIAVIGASGHAAVVIDAIQRQGSYEIAGLIDGFAPPQASVLGHAILGGDGDLPNLIERLNLVGVAVGIGDNALRRRIVERLAAAVPELRFVSVVHPSAVIGSDVEIGDGTLVAAGAIIGPRSRIGRHCIVNTGASLDHDCELADYASVAPGVVAGGNCSIGNGSAVSIGAVLKHGISVGADTVIGAGALVLRNIEANVVAYGTPARVVRIRERGDRYL